MPKLIFLCVIAVISGCAQKPVQTTAIPITLTQGVTVPFPTSQATRIEGDDITFYDQTGFLGFVQRDYLALEDQPASDFIMRAFELTKERNFELEEINLGSFVGYIIYKENTATMYFAKIQDKETVYTISIKNRNNIEQILASLVAAH